MPNVVLKQLKKYYVDLISVASMLESGGSSGQLRIDFNVLPSGDLRRQFLALSNAPNWKKELFKFRLGREIFDDKHSGHSFGNIFISGLEHILKDFSKTLKIVSDFLEIKGRVLPATIENSYIYAILESGEIIFGEDEIDVPRKHDPKTKIKEIFLTKRIKAYPPTLKAIKEADFLIIGPGDLYSSLATCFLPEGMTKAIKETKAKKIYICNLLNKNGETNNFSVLDFTKEIEKYLGTSVDFVIYNTKKPTTKRLETYRKNNLEILRVVKVDKNLPKEKFIGGDFLADSGPLFHDPQKLIKVLLKICKP